ncbi:MAG TPA: hypothetical protein PKD37_02340 [Oligoflexia bacterium]|nr:hypothetical protein [Oligoflexia bacterium]HMP26809.1 hypothetical protein [Oligoflexia bacterium]
MYKSSTFKNNPKAKSENASSPTAMLKLLEEAAKLKVIAVVANNRIRTLRFIEAAIKKRRPSLPPQKPKIINAEDLEGEKLKNLKNSTATYSLFEEEPQAAVVINNCSQLKKEASEWLIQLAKSQSTSSEIFIACAKQEKNEKKELKDLREKLTSVKAYFEIPELDEKGMVAWLTKELQTAGFKNPTKQECLRIAQFAESDPDSMMAIIEKLSLLAEDEQIPLNKIDGLNSLSLGAEIFKLCEVLPQKNFQTIPHLTELLINGNQSIMLNAAVAKQICEMLAIKDLNNTSAIEKTLSIQHWLAEKKLKLSSKFSLQKLVFSINALLNSDYLLKNRSLGPPFPLLKSIAKIENV